MKNIRLLILTTILAACGTAPDNKGDAEKELTLSDTTHNLQTANSTDSSEAGDPAENDNATYFIVIADTGSNYGLLRQKMSGINRQLNIPIDTMGRYYNEAKDLIALPDNDDDEIYAGDYFPRRFPSENLSLEYLNFYQKEAGEKTIALVTGIYETEQGADRALAVLQKTETNPFKIKAEIYIGCMH